MRQWDCAARLPKGSGGICGSQCARPRGESQPDLALARSYRSAIEAAGHSALEYRQCGFYRAGLLDGLGKFGIADVCAFALENEPGGFQCSIRIDHKVSKVVRCAARHSDFEAYPLRQVFILID